MFPLPDAGCLPNAIQSANLRARERVLHIHLATDADPQEGLCRALQEIASAYACIDQRTALLQQRILEVAAVFKPTLVFAQIHDPSALLPETARFLRQRLGANLVTWNGDIGGLSAPEHAGGWLCALGREADLSLYADTGRAYLLRLKGVTSGFLAAGYDDELFRPGEEQSAAAAYAISFIGSNYAGTELGPLADLRRDAVAALHAHYGGQLGLFGGGWEELDPAAAPLHYTLSPAIYHVSATALEISSGAQYPRCVSSRLFRALGCGVPVFAYRMEDAAGLGLIDGENCVLWKSVDELLSKLAATTPAQLISLRAGGLELAHSHTWSHRMREMLWMLYQVRGHVPIAKAGLSQDCEDEIVERLFAGRDPAELRLLDLGANDGVSVSNSRRLMKSGWEGVLVEPALDPFSQLLANYSGDDPSRAILVHAVIATDATSRIRPWWEAVGRGALSSTLFAHMKSHPSRGPQSAWTQFYTPIVTPEELIAAFPGPYHFVSIDTEGDSVGLLRGLPLLTMQTEVICIEYEDRRSELLAFLGPDWAVVWDNGVNVIMQRKV